MWNLREPSFKVLPEGVNDEVVEEDRDEGGEDVHEADVEDDGGVGEDALEVVHRRHEGVVGEQEADPRHQQHRVNKIELGNNPFIKTYYFEVFRNREALQSTEMNTNILHLIFPSACAPKQTHQSISISSRLVHYYHFYESDFSQLLLNTHRMLSCLM